MSMQKRSLSVRAAVERLLAFSTYATVLGFIVTGVVAMCVPGLGIA